MKERQSLLKIVVFLSLVLILAGGVQVPQSAWASMEDAAVFYEELDPHGDWVEYGNYGPVWYPTQVQENWRPYVNGRWSPSEEGYVFETGEPWGWATYHYGNWMPTEEYGWVWVPGRTWYPNTVTWRTSAESESPDGSYIGWAPIPPPNYTPQPGYYPEGYYGGDPYRGPQENLITAPFWIFIKAASFLLGFSEPYAPTYSYWGCNCLVPPPVVPYYYHRTLFVHNYYTPRYYPRGIIGAGRGYYNWGPPIPYVSRVTRIKQVTINNYVQRVNIYQRRNVAPPPGILARRTYFRNVLPPAMAEHRPLPRGVRVRDIQAARGNLARPNLVNVNVIKDAPNIQGNITKNRMAEVESGQWRHGVAGVALPASAVMRSNQQMENHLRKIPTSQRIEPVSPRARKWQVPQTPGAAASQPVAVHQRRGPELTPGMTAGPSATTSRTVPPRMRPGAQGTPQTVTPVAPGASQEPMGRYKRTPTSEGVTPKAYPASQAGVPQERIKPGEHQKPGSRSRQKQTPQAAVTPGQPPGQGQKARYTPGTPPPSAAAPVRVQPQRRLPAPQPQQQQQQQQQQRRQKKKTTPDQFQGFGSGGPKMTGIQPRQRQLPSQPPRQIRQQPAPRQAPQVRQLPRSLPQSQVRQQPQPQPQRQVRQQPQMLPQRQVRQQPRQQPGPQAQNRSQAQQQQRRNKQEQQQN